MASADADVSVATSLVLKEEPSMAASTGPRDVGMSALSPGPFGASMASNKNDLLNTRTVPLGGVRGHRSCIGRVERSEVVDSLRRSLLKSRGWMPEAPTG